MNKKLLLVGVVTLFSVLALTGFGCPDEEEEEYIAEFNRQGDLEFEAALKAKNTPTGSWEFLDPAKGWTAVNSLVPGTSPYLIVASDGDPDMTQQLPIKVELKVDGETVLTTTITGDPKKVCRDATGCSIQGPPIKPEWEGKKLELIATGKNGQVLAVHTQ